MSLNYRKVHREELPLILDLVKGLALYENAPEEVTATVDMYYHAYDENLIDVIIAEEHHEIIGMALYYMTFSTWKGKMLYLEDIYLPEKHRRRGIGQHLLDLFIEEARQRKCTMVKWQVLDWNTPAIEFYKKNDVIIEDEWYNCKIIF